MRAKVRESNWVSNFQTKGAGVVKQLIVLMLSTFVVQAAHAWEAKVTAVLQHGTTVAVYLSPDPGPGSCSVGQPYLLQVDDTPAAKQRFAMVLMASITGQLISGYDDGCDTSIWNQSRPLIWRLAVSAP